MSQKRYTTQVSIHFYPGEFAKLDLIQHKMAEEAKLLGLKPPSRTETIRRLIKKAADEYEFQEAEILDKVKELQKT